MIRSNLLARRVASSALGAVPRASAAAAPSSAAAADALVLSYRSNGATPSSPSPRFSSPMRHFSSGDAATELGSILQREINEETEAAEAHAGGVPPELADLRSDVARSWTIIDGITGIGGGSGETGSGATVRMFRKESGSKGAKIGIVFHCQDTEEDAKFDEESFFNDEQVSSEDGDEEEPPQAVRFGVVVSKGGKTVVIQCRSGFELSVESVMVRDGDTESVLSELAGGEGLHASLYQVSFNVDSCYASHAGIPVLTWSSRFNRCVAQGPEFTELAEDLQESFLNYVVNECGVDEEVTAFISMYSDYREQEEYVSFMKTAIDILD